METTQHEQENDTKDMLDAYTYYIMQWEPKLIDLKILARAKDYITALFILQGLRVKYPLKDLRIVREFKA